MTAGDHADAGRRLSRSCARRRSRRRAVGVTQSVRGQRHQGFFRSGGEVRRGATSAPSKPSWPTRAGRSRRRRRPISPTGTSPAPTSTTCAGCCRRPARWRARGSRSTWPTARRPRRRKSCSSRSGFRSSSLGDAPDGRNINLACGSTHPAQLAAAVVAAGCRLGVAFDGDGDRAIFVDHRGRIVDGDAVLLMLGAAVPSGEARSAATPWWRR